MELPGACMGATSAILLKWPFRPLDCIALVIFHRACTQRALRGDGSRQALWVERRPAAAPGALRVRGSHDHAIGDTPGRSGAAQLETTPLGTRAPPGCLHPLQPVPIANLWARTPLAKPCHPTAAAARQPLC